MCPSVSTHRDAHDANNVLPLSVAVLQRGKCFNILTVNHFKTLLLEQNVCIMYMYNDYVFCKILYDECYIRMG